MKGKMRLGKFICFAATLLAAAISVNSAQTKKSHTAQPAEPNLVSGKRIFVQYCASCHGENAKGDGPAATALNTRPPDLTTLSRRFEGKYPAGYVGAVLKFGRSVTAHGSEDMPVWGARFKVLDPEHDPTGQRHVNDVNSYLQSLQVK